MGGGTAGALAGRGADTADRVVLDDTVSLAMLLVMETLSPLERAVFVLREAFDYSFAEIAAMLDRTESAVRQLLVRARAHVHEKRPRYPLDDRRQGIEHGHLGGIEQRTVAWARSALV